MRLDEWMDWRGVDDDWVAAQLDCTRVAVSRIRRRLNRPDWKMIPAIQEMTNNYVTANDFVTLTEPERGRPSRVRRFAHTMPALNQR